MRSPRAPAGFALGLVLAGLLEVESDGFRIGIVLGLAVLGLRFFALERWLGGPPPPVLRKRLNIGFTVLLWIGLQLLLFVGGLPADLFLPLVATAGIWFLLDQPPGRLVDALFVGVVTLVIVIGLCRLPSTSPLEIARAVVTAWCLLLAYARLDALRVLEYEPALAGSPSGSSSTSRLSPTTTGRGRTARPPRWR